MTIAETPIKGEEVRYKAPEEERYEMTMIETATKREQAREEATEEQIVAKPEHFRAEEKEGCDPELRRLNLCYTGIGSFNVPLEAVSGVVAAAVSQRCSDTAYNAETCRYR